ncbi:MAG: helix-turn-helix domain-containing protein [Oscillospiraceae bacterium]|jgi:transcriptional regulator with XRE-family HTH domain|nr:helix-turn-helix domain-containing protein [Oscillospiraceae bacterium]
MDGKILKQRIAANLAHYRKLAGMTQTELAARINYSDKSVSKWERAGGAPDIYVLVMLADLYGITVNDLISENAPLPPFDANRERRRVMVWLQLTVLVWLIATAGFTALRIFLPPFEYAWHAFLLALPASAAVALVFSVRWWTHLIRSLSVSALIWALGVCMVVMFWGESMYLIFIVCGVAQVLVLLWLVMQILTEKGRRRMRG